MSWINTGRRKRSRLPIDPDSPTFLLRMGYKPVYRYQWPMTSAALLANNAIAFRDLDFDLAAPELATIRRRVIRQLHEATYRAMEDYRRTHGFETQFAMQTSCDDTGRLTVRVWPMSEVRRAPEPDS